MLWSKIGNLKNHTLHQKKNESFEQNQRDPSKIPFNLPAMKVDRTKQHLVESIVLVRYCFVSFGASKSQSAVTDRPIRIIIVSSMHASRISPPCLMKISRRRPTRVGGSKRHVSLFRAHRSVHLCTETVPPTFPRHRNYNRTIYSTEDRNKILIKSYLRYRCLLFMDPVSK